MADVQFPNHVLVRSDVEFTDTVTGLKVDPDTIIFSWRGPDEVLHYRYINMADQIDSTDIHRTALGTYWTAYDVDISGLWNHRWRTIGTVKTSMYDRELFIPNSVFD